MATVIALQSFIGRLESDVRGPGRTEKHSTLGESVFPGPVVKEGKSIQVIQGQMFEDNHPAVKAFPEMFGKIDSIGRNLPTPVEQATAAPGERRAR